MSVQIKAKQGNFNALGYNSWAPLLLPVTTLAAPEVQVVPLALNHKIISVAYSVASLATTGLVTLNAISGVNYTGYEGSGAHSSYAYCDLGGTFLPGDVINVTVAGVNYPITLTSRFTANLTTVAQAVVIALSFNPAFNALYRVNSLGAEFVVQTLSYSTATPTFAVTVVSAAGTATASGANMVAGVAGALPTQPVLDQTSQGIAPSGTAVANNALFPVDIILPLFNVAARGLTGVVYCIENFDAIWPYSSTLMVIYNLPSGSTAAGTIVSSIYTTPVDNHRFLPACLPGGFHISSEIL